AHTFIKADSSFTDKLTDKAAKFLAAPPVKVLNLFQFGALRDPQFEKAAASFFSRLNLANKPIKRTVTVSYPPTEPGQIADFYTYTIRLRPANAGAPYIPDSDIIC